MATSHTTRRQEALRLAEELLSDIEFSRLPPTDLILKTGRLARLLDDTAAVQWLQFEISGYPVEEGNSLGAPAWSAATYSNRVSRAPDGKLRAQTTSLGELHANFEGAKTQLAAAVDGAVSISSANPNQWVAPPTGNVAERRAIRLALAGYKALIDKVVGAVHGYVAARYQELRFGSAVETAFEIVRAEVDATMRTLIPEALPKISAAFENAASDNPEHWANATSTCRRLLKDVADKLRPPGPDENGIKMGEQHYVNRLVAWIAEHSTSETAKDVISSDLAHFGERLDAAVDAGHQGAHSEVSRLDASRFITGTYLLLGDILRLRPATEEEHSAGGSAEPAEEQLSEQQLSESP